MAAGFLAGAVFFSAAAFFAGFFSTGLGVSAGAATSVFTSAATSFLSSARGAVSVFFFVGMVITSFYLIG